MGVGRTRHVRHLDMNSPQPLGDGLVNGRICDLRHDLYEYVFFLTRFAFSLLHKRVYALECGRIS